MSEELGREPTSEELAERMGITLKKLVQLRTVSTRPASLDAPIGDEDSTEFIEIVGDKDAPTPFEVLREKLLRYDINRFLNHLDEREAEIIRLRFGLDGEKPRTLEEVGEVFNVTRERVRQIQNIALRKLRSMMKEQDNMGEGKS
jgi:RNA polymerase primary sigma factor